jgi:hypothetical protein
MAEVAKKVADNGSIPANVKAQWEALSKDYESVRKKFGVPLNAAPAGGRGGGGGRGGAAADPDNVLAKTSSLRTAVMGIWESPSAALMRQYSEAKVDLPAAITAANAVIARASAMSQTLKKYDITLTAPTAPASSK